MNALGTLGSAVLAASGFSCARENDGTLWCWGLNNFGQLGDGTTTERHLPVQTLALGTGITSFSGRYSHACAVTGGIAMCWGDNRNGQLGDGTTSGTDFCADMTKNCVATPQVVKGLCP